MIRDILFTLTNKCSDIIITNQGLFSWEIVRDLLIFLPKNLIEIGLLGEKSHSKM